MPDLGTRDVGALAAATPEECGCEGIRPRLPPYTVAVADGSPAPLETCSRLTGNPHDYASCGTTKRRSTPRRASHLKATNFNGDVSRVTVHGQLRHRAGDKRPCTPQPTNALRERGGGVGDHRTTSDDHCTPPKGGEPPDPPLNDLHAAVDDKLTSATGKSPDPPPTTTNSRVSLKMTTEQ
jgi:hypothetical protein